LKWLGENPIVSFLLTLLGLAIGALGTVLSIVLYNKQEEKAKKKDQDAAQVRLREISQRRQDVHWRASAQLLNDALLKRFPEQFRNDLINAILERLYSMVSDLNPKLFRASRLFVEICLLRSAQLRSAALPLEEPTLGDSLVFFQDTFREVHSRLTESPDLHSPIAFDDCFKLGALESGEVTASSYFAALKKLDSEKIYKDHAAGIDYTDRFLTSISVENGFVAPMYLVRGLLSQFETDWRDALQRFNRAIGQDPAVLRAVQVFEFYCWLLWGPSIPVCDCLRWAGNFRVLQYGYGDENNSFPLILDDRVYDDSWPMIRARLREAAQLPGGGEAEPLPMAIASKFQGTLVWGPSYLSKKKKVPNVYTLPTMNGRMDFDLKEVHDKRPRRSGFDGLMLRAGGNLAWETGWSQSDHYYSAYLWIMFEVCDAEGKPLYERPEDRWRSLFPLFEHSNVAQGQTLLFLKHRLAEKARKAIEQLEGDESQPKRRFRYLCAADDSGAVRNGDGHHRIHFRTEDKEDRLLRNDVFIDGKPVTPRELLPIEKQRLRNILIAELPNDEARTRMFAPHSTEDRIITSCDLPDIIEDFYRDFLEVALKGDA
jgi:hypothetical protein